MSTVPAQGFNLFEAGVQAGPNFFVLGPLSPGCILVRARVTASCSGAQDVRLRWGFALGSSESAGEAGYVAGYIPFRGNGEGVALATRLPFAANVADGTPQYFVHEFGRRIVSGSQWIIVALGADSSDLGWIWIGFEVVGVQQTITAVGGRAVVTG